MTSRTRSFRVLLSLAALVAGVTLAIPAPASGQLWKRVRDRAKRAAENESLNQIENLVRGKVRCVFTDAECIRRAKEDGEDVVLTDSEGEFVLDDEGMPVSDPDEAADILGEEPPGLETLDAGGVPGLDEAYANYDFVPGDDILFYDDYSEDKVGDFPRRMTFRMGNWDVVEWSGGRYLRNTGPRHSAVEVPLSKELPETFTIEFDAYFSHGNHRLALATALPPEGAGAGGYRQVEGNQFTVGVAHGTGVVSYTGGVESTNRSEAVAEGPVPIRIMVDGQYAKVYVDHTRVANVPNAEFIRSGSLYIENIYSASAEQPMLVGPIRVAGGGTDLYDVLEAEGRVTTHGILFAVNSATIRPESTPTVTEIGEILRDHPDLRLSIEGHTDADGDDALNQTLSEDRAAAVKALLVQEFGIDESRLETVGHGESTPVAPNDSPEGKQENRRVELVRIS